MLVVSSKSKLGCEAGCGPSVSCSDHGRIVLGSSSDHARIGPAVEMTLSSVLKDFLRNFAMQFCVAGAVYLVMLEGEACCSAHCK